MELLMANECRGKGVDFQEIDAEEQKSTGRNEAKKSYFATNYQNQHSLHNKFLLPLLHESPPFISILIRKIFVTKN